MFNRQELYGWKGFAQLMALLSCQGLLALLFDVELFRSDAARGSPQLLLLVAGAMALLLWHWHLLMPTLVRFELVFMPKLERRLLAPLVALAALAALAAAVGPAELRSIAVRGMGAAIIMLSVLSFAAAWLLGSMLRSELSALGRMREHFEQFRAGRAPADLQRIERYLEQRRRCLTPGMPIRGVEFPGLTSRPWHEPASLAWTAALEADYPSIREEVLSAVAEPARLEQYDYLGVSSPSWKSLMLLREPNGFLRDNCTKLPKTLALLRSLPIVLAREVMVSVLAPRARIPPHRDSGNITLTCQLGIQIPARGCDIRVGRERRQWSAGKTIVFDTAYEHEVCNDSDEARVVLLFDFLHPDLTQTEQAFFKQWALLRRVEPAVDAAAPGIA